MNSSNCRIPQPSIINSATRNMNAKSLENQENVQAQNKGSANNDKHMTNDGPKQKQGTGAPGSQTRVQNLYQPMIIDKKFNLSLVAANAQA